ncbi:MAG: alanine dehydrogenase [Bacteroidota bacterium]
MSKRKVPIPKIFTSGQYRPQEETLEVQYKPNKLFIGIPKESSFQENRVALTPSSVLSLVNHGHRVVVETNAGEKASFTDNDYSEAGADIAYSKAQVFKSDIIIKVAPPTLDEVDLLAPNQMVISPIHLPTITAEYVMKIREKRVIALAMEYIQDNNGSFPIVRTLSEIAGTSAMLTAAELLTNVSEGRGILLGGVSGVPPAKVVILGAGVVAEYAVRTALGLGAQVRVFDNNVYKLMRLQSSVGQRIYTSSIIQHVLEEEIDTADVAIGAIHSVEGRSPIVVSEEMVMNMRHGAVIIDVSIDQGGCFATSRVTTHEKPTFIKHGVIHYCVPNIASRVSRTASSAVSNILTPILLEAETTGGLERLIYNNSGLRHGVYSFKGSLTNRHLGERFGIKHTDLDLLMMSGL